MKTLVLLLSASIATTPLLAQDAATPATAATQAAPQVSVGASVTDTSGAPVGTVASVANGNATIDTGMVKAAVPIGSFASGPSGLVLGMTKAQLEAAVAQAQPAEIAVGTPVVGPRGDAVGKVAAVNGNLVTVETAKTKAQLPKTAFAQNANGSLAIGMSADQLEAAAKAATPSSGN